MEFGESSLFEGDFASVQCIAKKGNKPIKFQWYLNGVLVENSNDIIITNSGGRLSSLTLESVKSHHSGEYMCVASNRAGSDRVKTSLLIHGNIFSTFLFNLTCVELYLNKPNK